MTSQFSLQCVGFSHRLSSFALHLIIFYVHWAYKTGVLLGRVNAFQQCLFSALCAGYFFLFYVPPFIFQVSLLFLFWEKAYSLQIFVLAWAASLWFQS
jgi:hypothetical protein